MKDQVSSKGRGHSNEAPPVALSPEAGRRRIRQVLEGLSEREKSSIIVTLGGKKNAGNLYGAAKVVIVLHFFIYTDIEQNSW